MKVGFADPRRTYNKAFERYALELSRHMTIQDVVRPLGISWDVIKEIQKRNLEPRYARPKLKKLKRIAIDEINVKKKSLAFLSDWVYRAGSSGIAMLQKFDRTLAAH